MPDVLVGAAIRPDYWSESKTAESTLTQGGITDTSPAAGASNVEVTWVAPLSGAAWLIAGFGARSTARVYCAPATWLGSTAGPQVVNPAASFDEWVTSPALGTTGYQYVARRTMVTGLTPGATYLTRHVRWVETAGQGDVNFRDINVIPVPMGGGPRKPDVRITSTDTPAVESTTDNSLQSAVNTGSYIEGGPAAALYFTAPTSGRVVLTPSIGARAVASGARAFLAPEIVADGPAGAQVLAADAQRYGVGTPTNATKYYYASRGRLVTGLDAGRVYFARALMLTSGGACDFLRRSLMVEPAP